MQNDPITKEMISHYETITGTSYPKLQEIISTISQDEYYDFEYYLLNTFYWSKKSNEIIWEIFQNFVTNSVDNLLDFGCGSGLYTKRLSSYCNKYFGTDISVTGLNVAQEINRGVKNAVYIDLTTFNKLNTKYDLIFCSETLDHIEDTEATLRKLESVLKPGGEIIITTTTMHHYLFRIIFQHMPSDVTNKNFKKALARLLIFMQALFDYTKRKDLMQIGLDRDDHVNAFTLRQHKYLANKVGLCVHNYEYFNCKDIFPSKSKFFRLINNLLKRVFRRSKIYGPNIMVSLKSRE